MGITERKIREKEERRALILNKAKDLILEQGVDLLSMQEIANRSELSKATLYLYFLNKEALLDAILEDAASTFVAFVRGHILPEASGLEGIHALWSSYLNFFWQSQDIFILIGISRYVNPGFPLNLEDEQNENSWPLKELIDLIAELLGRGVADGTIDAAVDPDKTARIVIMVAFSIIDQVTRLPRLARDDKKIHTMLRDTFEILLRGLAGKDSDLALLVLPES